MGMEGALGGRGGGGGGAKGGWMIPAGLGCKSNWVVGDDCPDQGFHKGHWETHDCRWHHKRPCWEKHVVPLLEEHIHPVDLHPDLHGQGPVPGGITHMHCQQPYQGLSATCATCCSIDGECTVNTLLCSSLHAFIMHVHGTFSFH